MNASQWICAAAVFAAAAPVQALEVVDWTSGTSGKLAAGTVTVSISVTGASPSVPLLLSGGVIPGTFGSGFFSGPVSLAEAIEVVGRTSAQANTYTVMFSAPVSDLRLHFGSLASTLSFSQPVTKLSGQASFVASGSQLAGVISNAGIPTDANGTLSLAGSITSFSFTAIGLPGVGSGDGIAMQIAATPVPEPSTWVLFGLGAIGLLRRRRA